MSMKKLGNAPKFNPKKPHGTIYGSGGDSSTARAAFCQNGHYYAGSGEYLGSDPDAKGVASEAPEPAAADPGTRVVREEELDELLKHPKAAELLTYPQPTLAAMVSRAGGPSFAGDNAPRLYVAWLLKFVPVA